MQISNPSTIKPVRDLKPGTTYTLVLPAGAVKSLFEDEPLKEEFRLVFTTERPDTNPPKVMKTEPPAGGELDGLIPTIKVYFSEPVYPGGEVCSDGSLR